MIRKKFSCLLCQLGLLLVVPTFAKAATNPWYPLGPFGGDARSFAADPNNSKHLFLGTVNGWLYESRDDGSSWTRVAQPGKRNDLIIEHVLVDPSDAKQLIVGAYSLNFEDGGIFLSQDSGRTWHAQAQLKGQSVLSMARSVSEPHTLVVGTLKGVYRSTDDGAHWDLISPADSKELHEVESVAIDPVNPKIIYAGTWHLPWKTTDGGATWTNIKKEQGILEDSDVFSIIVDPQQPSTVYLSACSGIYKSLDAAEQFKRIQGIPRTAIRTRKLLQDPKNRDTVYAGTTEGLYKTTDAGKNWVRTSSPNVIVNDVYVDPANPQHVLLATDRGGILRSEDGGGAFEPSNAGFSSRQVSSITHDLHDPSLLYVGIVNDKESGGVFQSKDGGLKWEQQNTGLAGRDVFSLATSSTGTLLAGTSHGIFRFQPEGWTDSSNIGAPYPVVEPKPEPEPKAPVKTHTPARRGTPSRSRTSTAHKKDTSAVLQHRYGAVFLRASMEIVQQAPAKSAPTKAPVTKKRAVHKEVAPVPVRFDSIAYALVPEGDVIYAGTADGLLRSGDDGHIWNPVGSLDMKEIHFFAAQKGLLLASGYKQLSTSADDGKTWETLSGPSELTRIGAVAIDEAKTLWVGGREGIFLLPPGVRLTSSRQQSDTLGHRLAVTICSPRRRPHDRRHPL